MKSELIDYKRYLPLYRKELFNLLGYNIESDKLLSLERSKEIGCVVINKQINKITFEFEKEKSKVVDFINRFQNYIGKSSLSYCYSHYSKFCGAIEVDTIYLLKRFMSILELKDSLINLISIDLNNELVIDFYYEKEILFLDIEIKGESWGDFPPDGSS